MINGTGGRRNSDRAQPKKKKKNLVLSLHTPITFLLGPPSLLGPLETISSDYKRILKKIWFNHITTSESYVTVRFLRPHKLTSFSFAYFEDRLLQHEITSLSVTAVIGQRC